MANESMRLEGNGEGVEVLRARLRELELERAARFEPRTSETTERYLVPMPLAVAIFVGSMGLMIAGFTAHAMSLLQTPLRRRADTTLVAARPAVPTTSVTMEAAPTPIAVASPVAEPADSTAIVPSSPRDPGYRRRPRAVEASPEPDLDFDETGDVLDGLEGVRRPR